MSLSFEDSLKNNEENTGVTNNEILVEDLESNNMEVAPVMAYSMRSAAVMADTLAEAEDWERVPNASSYKYYNDEYSDVNFSTIDESKNIILDPSQFNITQEKNSQYIPFQIPRYYDGFDLTKTKLGIYYVNKNKDSHTDIPVDVYYNDNYIRFAWLVSEFATQVAGILQFEIHAVGANSKGEPYTWKSKSIDKLNVLQSLEDVALGEIGLGEEEIQSWYNQITHAADIALQARLDAEQYAKEAAETYQLLQDGIADEVQSTINATVAEIVDGAIADQLEDYYTKNEIDQMIEDVKPEGYATEDYVDTEIGKVNDKFGNLVNLGGDVLTVEQFVKQEVEAVDVSDELGDLGTNEDGTKKTVVQYVDEAVAAVDVSEQLKEYAKKDEINEALDNISLDGYATETYVENKVSPLSSAVENNISGLSTLGETVTSLQNEVNSIDKSPRKTYEATYGDIELDDGTVQESMFTLWETEGDDEPTVKSRFKIVGGGGGSAVAGNDLKIYYDQDEDGKNITQYVFTKTNVEDNKAIIYYGFSGTDSVGDSVSYANAVWKTRRGTSGSWTTLPTETIYPNEKIEFNASKYISTGIYQLSLSVTDDSGGFATKTWTIQIVDVRIESSFNDTFTYPIGEVSFNYTSYGAVPKVVHFVLDGTEIGTVATSSSGIPASYPLPSQTHGSHLLDVYMTATINNDTISSNHIYKDILWRDPASSIPLIGCATPIINVKQHNTVNIKYTVVDPSTETPEVTWYINGEVASVETLTEKDKDGYYTYPYKANNDGAFELAVVCGEAEPKKITINVEKLDIDVIPVTAGLAFDFNPVGYSNNMSETERLWSDGDVKMSVSDNFDWVNGGYHIDENGDQYFCIKAGTSAEIDYQLFADDAKKNGKEFKLVFKTTNVAKPDATFLHCMDNTTGTDHIGIQMDVHEAFIYGQSGKLDLAYSEEDIIEFEFNISKNTEAIPMVMGYEDGVSSRPMVYDDSHNFTQNTPKVISLGSEDCDLHIYRFKVYNTSLTDRGILNNFIADARNAEEMVARYDRNQIYDENQNLDPDVFAEKCPWLRVYKVSAPYFTNNKSDKVPNTTIQQIYKGGDPVLDNWTAYNSMHSGQGTSSNNYGAAGRNLDFIMNKSGIDGVEPYFVLGDGTRTDKITLTRTSVPVAYLNGKVNVASSNNLTNPMLANRYNEFQPYNRPFIRGEGVDTSFIKDTMEFHNCVIFVQETDEDVSTHREFADTNWHFYALGNIGDSKKSDKTRLTDINDKYECCVEIMDVELPLSDFPVDTMYNAMGYKEDETTHERTYTWAKNENLGILYEKINGEYVLTEDTEVNLDKTYYVDILEHDDFSEDYIYGWRYLYEGDDEEENAEVFDYCKQKWIELYRFITTSTDEEFKNRFDEYFVKDTALYYYLFTTRYCMVDNRSKNLFFHYGKTGEVDAQGNPIRKWDLTWGYDMD